MSTSRPVRAGVLALPLAGALFVVTVLLRGEATTRSTTRPPGRRMSPVAATSRAYLGNAVALAALRSAWSRCTAGSPAPSSSGWPGGR
jgi:hypothetical protein